MAKNKGRFGRGRPVSESDEFVSGVARLAETMRPYALRLGILAAVIALGVSSWIALSWWKERTAAAATELYGQLMALQKEAVGAERSSATSKDEGGDDPENGGDEGAQPRFASVRDKAEAELKLLQALHTDYGSTDIGERASLLLGATLLQLGRYEEAIQAYRGFRGSEALLAAVAREGVAYAREAEAMANQEAKAREAGLQEALRAFRQVQPDPGGPRADHALYHQARILMLLGDRQAAIEALRKVLDRDPPSPLAAAAKQRLALWGVDVNQGRAGGGPVPGTSAGPSGRTGDTTEPTGAPNSAKRHPVEAAE